MAGGGLSSRRAILVVGAHNRIPKRIITLSSRRRTAPTAVVAVAAVARAAMERRITDWRRVICSGGQRMRRENRECARGTSSDVMGEIYNDMEGYGRGVWDKRTSREWYEEMIWSMPWKSYASQKPSFFGKVKA